MSTRLVSKLTVALGLVVGFADGALAQAAKGEPVRIPHVTTYSGASASWGDTMNKAAQIAAAMINEKGGVHGRPLDFYKEDAPYDNMPNAMVTIKKVIRDPGVQFILDCGGATTVVLAAHDLLAEYKVPCFAFSSAGHWRVGKFNPYLFRLLPQVYTAMPVLLPKVIKKHNVKSVGLAFTNNDEAPVANAKVYRDLVKQFNLKLVEVSGQLKESEYRAQVTKLKSDGIDLIAVSMQPEDIGQFLRQAREGGLNQPVIGDVTLVDKHVPEYAKGKIGTAYAYGIFDPSDPRPYVQEFLARFKKEVGREPGAFEAITGDAVFILASIMNKAKSIDREAIRAAWAETKSIQSFAGNVGWNGSGDAIRDGVVIQMYDKDEKIITVPESYWGTGS